MSLRDGVLSFTGSSGSDTVGMADFRFSGETTDYVGISYSGEVTDGGANGCRAVAAERILCVREGITCIEVRLGDGADGAGVGVAGVAVLLQGEGGDDVLETSRGAAPILVDGGAGNDGLRGGDPMDRTNRGQVYEGGDGDDQFDVASGVADDVRCGGGSDRVNTYDPDDRLVGREAKGIADDPTGDDRYETAPTLTVFETRKSRDRRVRARDGHLATYVRCATATCVGEVRLSILTTAGGRSSFFRGGPVTRFRFATSRVRLVQIKLSRAQRTVLAKHEITIAHFSVRTREAAGTRAVDAQVDDRSCPRSRPCPVERVPAGA